MAEYEAGRPIAAPGTPTADPEGLLWRAKPGATSTFEQLLHARTRFPELFADLMWNPWDPDAREEEKRQAMEVIDQWERAEPDFRQWTDEEIREHHARRDKEFKEEWARKQAERQARKSRYDPEREHARLASLEAQSELHYHQTHRRGLLDGTVYPAMPDDVRAAQVADEDQTINTYLARVQQLRDQVGDPESVIDADGWLPHERRELAPTQFDFWRRREITRLRERLQRDPTTPRPARAPRQRGTAQRDIHIQLDESRLAILMAVTRPTIEEMCADCARPLAWHRQSAIGAWVYYAGPCPRWPEYAERIRQAREILFAAARTNRRPLPSAPKPLAIIPSGLPISEIITRLTDIHAAHPDAEVRRGSANRWEIWPPRKPRPRIGP